MRAKEFTINIPITITLNGDNEPQVTTGDNNIPDEDEVQLNPVMISPLQQSLELQKASLGKESPVIDKLLAPSEISAEPEQQADPNLARIKQLMSR